MLQSVLGRIWEHYRERLRRVVRLRLDRRLQGRADPSDVLQEAFVDFQSRVLYQMGKPAEAMQEYQKALAIQQAVAAKPTAAKTPFPAGLDLARSHSLIGRLHAQEKRFNEAFAAQAVAFRRFAIQGGWRDLAELQEPDFDAIRGRDDLKKLLATLEKK